MSRNSGGRHKNKNFWLYQALPGLTGRAAHKADRAAGESPVRDAANVPVVMIDLRRGDSGQVSSIVKVPSGAGRARWRAAA